MMEAIYKYLKDPGWWFSAFLVAILASIIAGFTKDYLEKHFGIFLTWSRSRRVELREKRATFVAAWSASESRVTILLLHVLCFVVFFVGMLILLGVWISYLKLKYGFATIEEVGVLPWRAAFGLTVSVLFAVYAGVKTMRMISRAIEAMDAFCKTRALPLM